MLSIGAAKRKALADTTIGKHHTMAGNLTGARIAMQRITHVARAARTTCEQRHLAVGGNHPLRYLLDHLVHPLKKPSDAISRSPLRLDQHNASDPLGTEEKGSFTASVWPLIRNPAVPKGSLFGR